MLTVLLKAVLVIAFFLGLGVPINSLPEFLIFSTAFVLISFGALRLERWRLLAALVAIVSAFGLANLIKPPAIDEGFNVFIFKQDPGALSKGLPEEVFEAMAKEMRTVLAPLQCNPKQDGCWLRGNPKPDAVHVFSADGALDAASGYSRRVYDISFDHRDQLFSAAINRHQYHYYGTSKNPDRQLLPAFVSHRFPAAYEGSRLCWTGNLIRPSRDGSFERLAALEGEQCTVLDEIAERPTTITYGFDPAKQFSMRLDRTWPIAIRDFIARVTPLAAVALAVLLLVDFRQRRRLLVPALAFGATLLWAAGWDLASDESALLNGLTIYRGGTDGLTHDSMARDVLFNAVTGNWIEALRGGESVFYFQPAFRYVLAIGKFLFGETHYFYILIVALVPIAVHRLLLLLFPSRWAMGLFLVFVLTPIFERMGFSHMNYIYQLHRGHAEPLGYGAFLAAMAVLLPPTKHGSRSLAASPTFALVGGLLLALAVASRPNLALGAAVVATGACFILLHERSFRSIPAFVLGGASIFIVLLHNIVFGGRFVLLSDVTTNPFNLRMTPTAYWDAFRAGLELAFDSTPWLRMVEHLSEWNDPSDFYRLPILGITFYVVLQRKYGVAVRTIAATAIVQQGMLLFYNASGRYAYLAWMLCFLTSAVYFREELLPVLQRLHRKKWWRGLLRGRGIQPPQDTNARHFSFGGEAPASELHGKHHLSGEDRAIQERPKPLKHGL